MMLLRTGRRLSSTPLLRVREQASFFSSSSVLDPFNDHVKSAHRDRAAREYLKTDGEYEYLRDIVADNLVDRVKDISQDFTVALDIGCSTGNILAKMIEHADTELEDDDFEGPNGIKKLIQVDRSERMIEMAAQRAKTIPAGKLATEEYCLADGYKSLTQTVTPGSVDIALSGLCLHWENDIIETFKVILKTLKPDGVFIGAMLAGDTLHELSTCLHMAEQEREGGISPHISPMVRTSDACSLLSSAGFNLTTVDTSSVTVEYETAFDCMKHLSLMGESNASTQRRSMVSRDTLLSAGAIYQNLYGDESGYVPATFDIVFLIGWKPAPSQPQPQTPGSAKKGFNVIKPSV